MTALEQLRAAIERLVDEAVERRLGGLTAIAVTEWLTVTSAAARADCHAQTIRRAIRKGELEAVGAGRQTRISVDALDRWVRGRASDSPAALAEAAVRNWSKTSG